MVLLLTKDSSGFFNFDFLHCCSLLHFPGSLLLVGSWVLASPSRGIFLLLDLLVDSSAESILTRGASLLATLDTPGSEGIGSLLADGLDIQTWKLLPQAADLFCNGWCWNSPGGGEG